MEYTSKPSFCAPKPPKKIELRLVGALQEIGITVTRDAQMGHEWLLVGFGHASLKKKLEAAIKTLYNKFQFAANLEGMKALGDVLHRYKQGEYLSHD